ncbi:MAG: ABC transporter permease subunit [Hyphomicrobiales bacterium]|nr:ABC transporter permease subunit [Hyphomicrobiales bacterium]
MQMCVDPNGLSGLNWWLCYLTTNTHISFYLSFGTVLALIFLCAPVVMILGFAGALARRSTLFPLRIFGQIYTSMVRGVPDIVFFMFVPIAMDQAIEAMRHKIKCPEVTEPIFRGNDFVVCTAAKMPLSATDQWVHEIYGFCLALVAFAIVFGAFAANNLHGALNAVPKNQLETARAYGMSEKQVFWRIHLPQMWRYALPGLSNLWMILIKATPLLFLLGVEDAVYWAGSLGAAKTSFYSFPHGDWRIWYFAALLIFYLGLTSVSERFFAWLTLKVTKEHDRAVSNISKQVTA